MLVKPIAILGPTASGKSGLALQTAQELSKQNIQCEIVACDSVQIYKGFDIGSAKPSLEEQKAFPHHLIDVREAHQNFDAATYAELANTAITEITARGNVPLFVGGTGLYFRALTDSSAFHALPHNAELRAALNKLSKEELLAKLKELDPQRADSIHPNDHYRLARATEIALLGFDAPVKAQAPKTLDFFTVIKIPPRNNLHESIAVRAEKMLKLGLVEEVRELIAKGAEPTKAKPMQSIGYSQCVEFLQGMIPQHELRDRIIFATRQYAKRQCTWFKKVPCEVLDETTDLDPQVLIKRWQLENDSAKHP